MGKVSFKPGNMLYPLPAVLVTVTDKEGNDNVLTIGWTGTICSDPAMVSISVRPERYSYHMIEETGEFVINLTTSDLVYATDFCGVRSGKNVDKFNNFFDSALNCFFFIFPPIFPVKGYTYNYNSIFSKVNTRLLKKVIKKHMQ